MIANGVIGGKKLPVLANPAGAAQILSGYQAVGSMGELIEGAVPVLAAQTITPGAAAKTIASGQYLGGVQTIAGDADLVPGNIRSGVNIFGVSGTLEVPQMVSGSIVVSRALVFDLVYSIQTGLRYQIIRNTTNVNVSVMTGGILAISHLYGGTSSIGDFTYSGLSGRTTLSQTISTADQGNIYVETDVFPITGPFTLNITVG